MPIRELSISGYRSIRQIRLKLRGINVLTGPNGCGKSNLYRPMVLLAKAAAGEFASSIAGEGGMSSVLWAGVQKRFGTRPEPKRVKLGVRTDHFGFELRCGLPEDAPLEEGRDHDGLPMPASQFLLDPRIKAESVWIAGPRGGRVVTMEREGLLTSMRNAEGKMANYPVLLNPSESVLSQIPEPRLYPEISSVRDEIERWRFYDDFRTGPDAPLRRPRFGVLSPVLDSDGANLAAAIQTVIEIGDADTLRSEIDRALPGARLEVVSERVRFHLALHMPGLLRPLGAMELSGGTLRYLCLMAALLSPRPPALLGLREPETGIHPGLIPSVARLITTAVRQTQLWISTHSPALVENIEELSGETPVRLTMVEGETRIA